MICPKCGIEMKIGQAIKTLDTNNCRVVEFDVLIKAKDVELIDCLKCPNCGHSDDRVYIK